MLRRDPAAISGRSGNSAVERHSPWHNPRRPRGSNLRYGAFEPPGRFGARSTAMPPDARGPRLPQETDRPLRDDARADQQGTVQVESCRDGTFERDVGRGAACHGQSFDYARLTMVSSPMISAPATQRPSDSARRARWTHRKSRPSHVPSVKLRAESDCWRGMESYALGV
jgi:hypothetical protein